METINHEYYVSPELAKLLKEAGFDWEVKFFYQDGILRSVLPDELFNGNFEDIEYYYKHIGIPHQLLNYNDGSSKFLEEYSAPTLNVAQRWLREVKNISVDISSTCYSHYEYIIRKINQSGRGDSSILALTACRFYIYEEALEAGIKNALEIILEKEK